MNYKYIIYLVLAATIILAVILKDKIKASFLGMKLNGENTTRRNKANLKGNNNELKQGGGAKDRSANNQAKIKGDGNKIRQS